MLEGLVLTYRHTRHLPWVMRQLTLRVAAGERLGIAGPSGIGKSTLGRLLAGYLRPEEGTVLVNGRPLPDRGYCPVQMLFQHPELAVNPRWKCRAILAEAHGGQEDLLPQLAINPSWLERYPHELSGGELQRICLARALGPQTRYLICDEMTSMVDALTQATLWQAVLAIARQRAIGLVIISHDQLLLQRLCERQLRCSTSGENGPMQLTALTEDRAGTS